MAQAEQSTDKKGAQERFCAYCDHRGIIADLAAFELGGEPLHPCPRCVQSACKCGGKEPYYHVENGHIVACPCREVRMRIERINGLYARSQIDKKYRWRFINEFNCQTAQEKAARMAAYEIITNFPKPGKGLFLWGNPGTGKTLLSTIILTELIVRHAVEGRFLKISRNYFQMLRSTFNPESANYGQASRIEEELARVPLLVIDDFGIQRDSEWEKETLYNLVDARYEAERFTIFTSNVDPKGIAKELFGGRIFSRISEMCRIMELSGPDRRENL